MSWFRIQRKMWAKWLEFQGKTKQEIQLWRLESNYERCKKVLSSMEFEPECGCCGYPSPPYEYTRGMERQARRLENIKALKRALGKSQK